MEAFSQHDYLRVSKPSAYVTENLIHQFFSPKDILPLVAEVLIMIVSRPSAETGNPLAEV
jgi:hypothetical protein